MARILIVEDDDTIGRGLQSTLSAHGHQVSWASSGRFALELAADSSFELALVDLGLPDIDGVDVCRKMRPLQPGCVMVVLTARREEMDVVFALEAGADDYLTKPFRLAELLARVQAHLRRGPATSPSGTSTTVQSLRVGSLLVDLAARRAFLGSAEIVLRGREFDLLARLATEPGTAVSRATLMADVWDAHWYGSTKTLDVHVAALRRKLSEVSVTSGTPAPVIVTLRAHGFRLESM